MKTKDIKTIEKVLSLLSKTGEINNGLYDRFPIFIIRDYCNYVVNSVGNKVFSNKEVCDCLIELGYDANIHYFKF